MLWVLCRLTQNVPNKVTLEYIKIFWDSNDLVNKLGIGLFPSLLLFVWAGGFITKWSHKKF